jgi:membrane protease YdiL (CAAX protease family)
VQHSENSQNGRVTLALLSLLLVVLGLLTWRAVTRGRGPYRRFKRLTSTRARRRVYARWLLESALVMGGLSSAVLLASWSYVPLVLRSTQGWAPAVMVRGFLGTPPGVIVSVVVLVVVVAGLIAPVGDIRALLPRVRGELKYGAGLGLQAGLFEELLFRLALPALLFGIVGNGPLAFGLACLLFGMLHLYQGAPGMLVSTALGLVFASLYVVTGSIAAPIVLHALVDLRSLVLIPIVIGGAWKRS